MLENALVPRASIDEIVGRRTQSLELFQQGYAMIRSAREMAGRAAPNGYLPTFPDNIKYMLESCSERNESDFNAGVTKLVDQAIWDHLIHVTGIEKLMDAEAREKFRHPLRTDPRSEEHTSELQSLMRNSYAVFCVKKK